MKLNFVLSLLLLVCCCSKNNSEPINLTIDKEFKSKNSNIIALLFYGRTSDNFDILGTGKRYYLGFKNNKISWIINYDLTESKGSYESGISDIKWLNDYQVLIKRTIDDQESDIIFDLKLNEFNNK